MCSRFQPAPVSMLILSTKKFAYLKQLLADEFPWKRDELERLSKSMNLPGFWRKLVTEYVDDFVKKTQEDLSPEHAEVVGRYGRLVREKSFQRDTKPAH